MKIYSLQDIFSIIKKNCLIILCSAIVFGGLFFVYAKHKASTSYSAERLMMVEQHHVNYNKRADAQVNANLSMIPTYEEMIESSTITDKAYKKLPKKIRKQVTKSSFADSINTKHRDNTLLIRVKATGNTAKIATASVNQVVNTAKTELPKMQKDLGKVTVYQKASVKDATIHTHNSVKKYTIAGIALGLILGMMFGFIKTSWKDVE